MKNDSAAIAWLEGIETFGNVLDDEARAYIKSRLEELAKLKKVVEAAVVVTGESWDNAGVSEVQHKHMNALAKALDELEIKP